MENVYAVIAILIVVLIIYFYSRRENLQCDCARNKNAMLIWESGGVAPDNISPPGSINPFFQPFSSSRPFGMSTQYIDVPISRMVGDHVPLE